MPELPEVESLRRSLSPLIRGKRVISVDINRPDVCKSHDDHIVTVLDLLQGSTIDRLLRHGKQLALVGGNGRVMCIGLGMTGAMEVQDASCVAAAHTHISWMLDDGRRMDFIDPRRFGGIGTFKDLDSLQRVRWSMLGPDALVIQSGRLSDSLRGSVRPVKAALLDQNIIAGVGNIYADETLFKSGVDPRKHAGRIDLSTWGRIVENLKVILNAAIDAGGSTIRDYRKADGSSGSAQDRHAVYGRGGEPCLNCGSSLRVGVVAGRTTVWCPVCQKR